MTSLTAEQLKREYQKAHVRVMACVNEPEKHRIAIARRDTIGELLHDYFGFTKLELEMLLINFTEKLEEKRSDKI